MKSTNKSLSQLLSQEQQLEKGIVKYKGNPRLVGAEKITEQQIRSKGGTPATESPRLAALKRRMAKSNASSTGAKTPPRGTKA